jgi:undecaprenyl diphosphate synthase
MFEKIKGIIKKQEEETRIRAIRHVALTLHGIDSFAKDKSLAYGEVYEKSFGIIKEILPLQIENNIPILTIDLIPEELKHQENFSVFLDKFIEFFNFLKSSQIIHENKIKITALGKWYDLPGRAVDCIKAIVDETKDYDTFFLNFCINYDGQEEIVDACKLIARQIKADKLDVDAINKEVVKENIYTSYFLPPDLIIKNGVKRRTSGLLLWDSSDSELVFTGKKFPEFTKNDFVNAVRSYQKGRL